MPILRSFRLSTYLTLALACLCLGYAEGDLLPEAPYITAVVIVLIAVAHRVEGRWSLSVQSANSVGAILVPALIGWIAFQFFRGPTGLLELLPFPANLLPYLGPVLMILIPAKLFRPKHVGDFWAIQGVGLLAVTLGCAMANDILFGALLILYTISFAWSLALFYLYRELQLEKLGEAAAEEPTSRWYLAPGTARWSLPIVMAGVAAFLVTPRPADRRWELSVIARSRMEVGLSDGAIDLNHTGSLEQNNEIAFEVYADDAKGEPKLDLDPWQRWRASSLSHYEGGRWKRDRSSGLHVTDRAALVPPVRMQASQEPDQRQRRNARLPDFGPQTYYLTYKLRRHVGAANIVADPVVWRPNDLPPILVLLTRSGAVQQHQDGSFEWLTMPGTSRPAYCQATIPLPQVDLSPPMHVADGNQEFLTWIPSAEMSARLRRWTGRILEKLVQEQRLSNELLTDVDPATNLPLEKHHEAIARALENYLAHSGEFTYTFDLGRKDKNLDPIEDFLYNTRAGHCQRFASALVLMLRSQGIPAQLVIGFRGCESTGGGNYLVRQFNAHAWVEALIQRSPPANTLPPAKGQSLPPLTEAYHWLSLDATPPGEPVAVVNTDYANWLDSVHAWGETVFRNFVLSYDASARDRALDAIWSAANEILGAPFFVEMTWVDMLAAGGAVMLIGLIALRWHRRRALLSNAECANNESAGSRTPFQDRLLPLLARFGYIPAIGQTAYEFTAEVASKLRSRLGDAAEIPTLLAEQYYRARFGGQLFEGGELAEFERQIERLERALDLDVAPT